MAWRILVPVESFFCEDEEESVKGSSFEYHSFQCFCPWHVWCFLYLTPRTTAGITESAVDNVLSIISHDMELSSGTWVSARWCTSMILFSHTNTFRKFEKLWRNFGIQEWRIPTHLWTRNVRWYRSLLPNFVDCWNPAQQREVMITRKLLVTFKSSFFCRKNHLLTLSGPQQSICLYPHRESTADSEHLSGVKHPLQDCNTFIKANYW